MSILSNQVDARPKGSSRTEQEANRCAWPAARPKKGVHARGESEAVVQTRTCPLPENFGESTFVETTFADGVTLGRASRSGLSYCLNGPFEIGEKSIDMHSELEGGASGGVNRTNLSILKHREEEVWGARDVSEFDELED